MEFRRGSSDLGGEQDAATLDLKARIGLFEPGKLLKQARFDAEPDRARQIMALGHRILALDDVKQFHRQAEPRRRPGGEIADAGRVAREAGSASRRARGGQYV